MNHLTTPRFWKCYDALPQQVRDLADKNYALLKENPKHPSLHFKKIGNKWSARVGIGYRALAVENESDVIWYWIGSHAEYDRLIA